MKIYSLEEIYTLDFEITSIFAQRQKWIDGVLFQREKPRSSGALIYLNGCTGQYTDLITGESFYAPLKSLLYLPYGGRYTVLNMESQKANVDAYLAEFNIVRNGDVISLANAPIMIENKNTYYIEKVMNEIVDNYESTKHSPIVLKSKIYELLAYISDSNRDQNDRISQVLKPALERIEKAPLELCSVEDLASMCGLSGGGFRRIFKQYTGKTPKEYMLDMKINTAKKLLEESSMSINEISEVLNFDTPAYFCRFFKNKTKFYPGEFRRLSKQ